MTDELITRIRHHADLYVRVVRACLSPALPIMLQGPMTKLLEKAIAQARALPIPKKRNYVGTPKDAAQG